MAEAAPPSTGQDARLVPVYESDRVWNAVTTTADGRVFVGFPGADGLAGPQVAEIGPDGRVTPYPDAGWNAGAGPATCFVRVNALRVGPDNLLWIVDAGAPAVGARQESGAARLIVVDPRSDEVVQVHHLDPAVREQSYVDDLRFNRGLVYLTDAGAPGLLVLDPGSGDVRRVLDGHPSTVAGRPLRADGRILREPGGAESRVHADQLEVSPDGRYLYYQPACGPLARVETRLLDDPCVPAEKLAERVETWVDTPSTGGTAIDAAGVIYLGDTDHRRILRITPDRQVETVVADPRLAWPDAMWLDSNGSLWIPAAQMHRTPGFNGGRQEVDYPVWLYRMHVPTGPAFNDHR